MTTLYYIGSIPYSAENHLRHFGILGMKWGVRRYQNPDGTLNDAGKARYSRQFVNENGRKSRFYSDIRNSKSAKAIAGSASKDKALSEAGKRYRDAGKRNTEEHRKAADQFFRMNDRDYKMMAKKNAKETLKNGSFQGMSVAKLTKEIMRSDLGQNLLDEFMTTDRGKKRFAAYNKSFSDLMQANKDLKKRSQEVVSNIMGEYGNRTVSYMYGNKKFNMPGGEKLAKDLMAEMVELEEMNRK